jgi:DNA-binding MarR family transcriptional regulator
LLPLIDDYEKGTAEGTVDGFLQYAHVKNETTQKVKALENEQLLKNQLGFYLNMLFRFMKIYTKTALKDTPVTTIDDFIFLADIHKEKSIRKTDLIKNNMVEIPSGIEVIKRLLKNNLVSEQPDTLDKRAVLLQITDYGRAELFNVFEEMNKVGSILAGNLSSEELFQMHQLLEKLAFYHQKIREEA